MGKSLLGGGTMLILIIIVTGIIFFAPSPVDFEISETTCLTKSCFVAQTVSLKLKVNPNGDRNISNIRLESNAIEPLSINIKNNKIYTNQSVEIPVRFNIKDSLEEGDYSVSFKANTDTNLKDILWIIKSLIFGNDITHDITFKVRYPDVEFKVAETKSTHLQKTYDINLMNKDEILLKCKTRIELSPDILLNHKSFEIVNENKERIIYESQYEEISPKLSTGYNSIEINANTMKATAQINIIPVCEIDGNSIIIKNQIRKEEWSHDKMEIEH